MLVRRLYFISKIKGVMEEEFNNIKKVEANGVTLYKASFEDIKAANMFVENKQLKEMNMRTFIPRNFVETWGGIRDVPLCWSEDHIKDGIISSKKWH